VECPISTNEGVKVADVIWVSKKRLAKIGGRKVLTGAPEICVEVLSDSNTKQEIEEKRRLYFEAGALEFWVCEQSGRMRFFLASEPAADHSASLLCPAMPRKLAV
jgi:Uma2 family endonuclease